MRHPAIATYCLASLLCGAAYGSGHQHPGCDAVDARQCVALAIRAMGGEAALRAIANEQLDSIEHRLLTEQSYRQAPFITAYGRTATSIDFERGRVLWIQKSVWPQSDPGVGSAESETTIAANDHSAVVKSAKADTPAGLAQIDEARVALELGPERLLLMAQADPGLHFEAPEMLRSTSHSVVAFSWRGRQVKVLINAFNHLPDAFESVRTFNDFWFAWGDVRQRVYYDNWKLIAGVVYPTNRVEERNNTLWNSVQILDVQVNHAPDDKEIAMEATAAATSEQSKGWNRPFSEASHVELAPGVDLYQGSWNVTFVTQDDGLLVIEAPISPGFTQDVLARARADRPNTPIKAILSTSDSWPHLAGVREAVAEEIPVYILDLNQPLIDQMLKAPHTLSPDRLQTLPRRPKWHVVAGPTTIGTGSNRMELYPLRGAATERQYMIYFPQHKLLYASDTLVLDADTHQLYDPELMYEVMQAAEREHLDVATVYAMHNGPVKWNEIRRLIDAELSSGPGAHS
jgi:hypothetical protein